jgi:GT2 family glycosyltransferase
VHDPPVELLRACLESVDAQTTSDWELCLVDDGSQDADVLALLAERSACARTKLLRRGSSGGIVAASHDALRLAGGEFVVLLDHDDRIEAVALQRIADVLSTTPDIDFVYTDEDKVDTDGRSFDVFHKPDWSPERLRSQNYCTHLSVARRSLALEVGGFRAGFDGSQDHDLILRVTERARRIHHVPEVLYHWCATPGSAAAEADAKPYAREAGRRAVEEQLNRLGIRGRVEHQATPGHYCVRRERRPVPGVSIVMPTAGMVREVWGVQRVLALQAVRSLTRVTDHPDVELIVVADPGTDPAVERELRREGARVIHGVGTFNWSRRCNEGVAAAGHDLVVLLNDDVLIEQPDWLDVMAGFFVEEDVGIVGARLLYADGTLQHGGILLNEQPLHIFHGFGGSDPGPFGLLEIDREVGAVTGACLMTTRRLWDELGGMREEFAVAFNDLDYCLRARATGRRIIWTAHATLYHFESQTRQPDAEPHEIALLYERWGAELHRDPYGNPNFAPRQAVWLPRERATVRAAVRQAWRSFRDRR